MSLQTTAPMPRAGIRPPDDDVGSWAPKHTNANASPLAANSVWAHSASTDCQSAHAPPLTLLPPILNRSGAAMQWRQDWCVLQARLRSCGSPCHVPAIETNPTARIVPSR